MDPDQNNDGDSSQLPNEPELEREVDTEGNTDQAADQLSGPEESELELEAPEGESDFGNSSAEEDFESEGATSAVSGAATVSDAAEPPNELFAAPNHPSAAPTLPIHPNTLLLPIDTGDGNSERSPDPAEQLFPREWRLSAGSLDSADLESSATVIRTPDGALHAIPQVQIHVSLLESRVMIAEAIADALEKFEPEFYRIAESEVERGIRNYQIEQNLLDW